MWFVQRAIKKEAFYFSVQAVLAGEEGGRCLF
jgi:hypothetical protein